MNQKGCDVMKDKLYAISKNKEYRIVKYYNPFFARWGYQLEESTKLLWILKFWTLRADDELCTKFMEFS